MRVLQGASPELAKEEWWHNNFTLPQQKRIANFGHDMLKRALQGSSLIPSRRGWAVHASQGGPRRL